MFSLKQLLVVVSAMGALVAMVAGPAQAANESGSAECAVEGQATTDPPVGIFANSGAYTFDELVFDCVVEDEDDGTVVASLDIDSSGTYENDMCGTGSAADANAKATLNSPTVPPAKLGALSPSDEDINYEVEFVDTVGDLTVNSGTFANDSTLSGDGTIQIAPAPTGALLEPGVDCTDGFAVTGNVHLDYAP